MTLGNFPTPYPDEVLYSLAARFDERMRFVEHEPLIRELFGSTRIRAVVDLPCHLDHLAAVLPPGYCCTADQFIDKHTLLPFYGPFLHPEQLAHVRCDMRSGTIGGLSNRVGNTSNRLPTPRWLRYCPICIRQDRESFGEAYWHRVHQTPGVEVCPEHLVFLENSGVLARSQTKRNYVSAEAADLHSGQLRQFNLGSSEHQVLLDIAQDAVWLLGQAGLTAGPGILLEKYRALLSNQGLATYRGTIQPRVVFEAFQAFYSRELLQQLQCDLGEDIEQSWLIRRLLRVGRSASTPLQNLLMIHFLGHTAETFFTQPIERQPFGPGPWPCLNSLCTNYQEAVIPDWQVARMWSSKVTGAFCCPTCGYTYSRSGPDRSPDDRFRVGRVIAYGETWEQGFKQLWFDPSLSFPKMARLLRVSKLKVKQQGARLELPWPMPGSQAVSEVPKPEMGSNQGKITRQRAIWQRALHEYPEAGITELKQKLSPTYHYLRQHDREWFDAHKPASKQGSHPHRDWAALDQRLACDVREAAEQLRNAPGRPVRITCTALSRAVGQRDGFLDRHREKLPLTAQVLDELVESSEACGVRRIQWETEQYRQQSIVPTRCRLATQAGTETLRGRPLIEAALDVAMKSLGIFEEVKQ